MKFSDTPLAIVYMHHLFTLAQGVRDNCAAAFEEAVAPATDPYLIQVSTRLHTSIDTALILALNMKKLLSAPIEKPKKLSRRVFEMQVLRATALRDLLQGIALDEVMNSDVRNSIEHFDEYIDQLNASLSAGEVAPGPMAAYNMAISAWEATNPRLYPIRLYVSADKTYYNMSRSVNLERLHQQAVAILDRIVGSKILGEIDAPGGLMVRLENRHVRRRLASH